jgi:hypothetical protein
MRNSPHSVSDEVQLDESVTKFSAALSATVGVPAALAA